MWIGLDSGHGDNDDSDDDDWKECSKKSPDSSRGRAGVQTVGVY